MCIRDSFVILYLVLHFPEVWKSGKVQKSKDNVTLFPSHEPFVILYLVRKKDQVVTLACTTAVRLNVGDVQVDPQLMFQRLSIVATTGGFESPQQFLSTRCVTSRHPCLTRPFSH